MWRRRYAVDQRDLQGNILCGYGNAFGYAQYLFVKVSDERAGRVWLRKLVDQVTDAVPWDSHYKPLSTLNVALTFNGLKSLGVPTHLYMAPREPHGWGELRHELFKVNVELDWFEKYVTKRPYTWEKAPAESEKPAPTTTSDRQP